MSILQPYQGGTGFASLAELASPGNPVGDAIALGANPTTPGTPSTGAANLFPNGVLLDFYKETAETTFDNAMTKAVAALGAKGGIVYLGSGASYTFNNLNIPKSIAVVGRYRIPPFPGTNQALDLTNLQWIRINSGGTVNLGPGAFIGNVAIAPTGMTFPQNSSSG